MLTHSIIFCDSTVNTVMGKVRERKRQPKYTTKCVRTTRQKDNTEDVYKYKNAKASSNGVLERHSL